MQNIFKQLLAPSWQQRQQASKACSQYYSYDNDLPSDSKQLITGWLLELGEQKNLYLTAILSFWSHVLNLEAKYKAASSRHINAFYQACIDRATCESWRKHDLEKHFPLDENDEKLQIDWLCSPSAPIYLITSLKDELADLQQQFIDTFPILNSSTADTLKRALSQMPQITDTTYQACLEEFRDSYETSTFQEFAQHINTPARVEQWLYFYSLESNRDADILDHYLYVAEYAPPHSAVQILTSLIDFYRCYPSVEKTSQLLHTFASLCRNSGFFPPFVIDFAMQVLAQERGNEDSFWGESLIYFLICYDAKAYLNDIIYFLDHPHERYHYTASASLPAIHNINNIPALLVGRLIKYGLFEGRFDPNFQSTTDKFFILVKSIETNKLKQFEAIFKQALVDYLDFEFSDDLVEDILPILQYLTKQGIDLNSDIKTIIEKIELLYADDIQVDDHQSCQSMAEILAQTKVDMMKQGLNDDEADVELQQSMLFMEQLFGVAEGQTLEEKLTQNSNKTSQEENTNEVDILLNALKQLIS